MVLNPGMQWRVYRVLQPVNDLNNTLKFLDEFLGNRILRKIRYPENLQGNFGDLTEENQSEWFYFTYHEVFRTVGIACANSMDRSLNKDELDIVKNRIISFL